MSGLTSAGAVFNLVVEELGDEDHVCEDVKHHCNDLRAEHEMKEKERKKERKKKSRLTSCL